MKMNIKVKVYDNIKYSPESKKVAEVEYINVAAEVKSYTNEEIFAMGFDDTDEYGEYLVVTHEDGETSTFRNSRVDAFIIR